jgi:aminoglycoside 6-adenylyltransferase
MLLISSRAVPNARLDRLSDYDVILIVDSIRPFTEDHSWIEEFGDVVVSYWDPVELDHETGFCRSGNIVQYAGDLKIDFGFWPVPMLQKIASMPTLLTELDAGYKVIIDKDQLTTDLKAPTFVGYIPSPPDEQTFLTNVNDFFIGVPYVAKCLLRDELLPAKWCLDYDMRDVYLRPMLEWRMECDHDWSVSPGALGKGLKRRLPPDIWTELEATYAGAEIEDNWRSLFSLITLYRRVARDVASSLGFIYPEEFDRKVTTHAQQMRESGPLV